MSEMRVNSLQCRISVSIVWKMKYLRDTNGGEEHPTFVHLAVCLTTGPKPLPKRAVHIVRSTASSFRWDYLLLSLRSPSSFLRLLPRLPFTSISPCIFPSITCCTRQFLSKMWPIQLAFRLLISRRIFLCSLTLCNTSNFSHDRSNWSSHHSPVPHIPHTIKKTEG
jgi:hypothetical protein